MSLCPLVRVPVRVGASVMRAHASTCVHCVHALVVVLCGCGVVMMVVMVVVVWLCGCGLACTSIDSFPSAQVAVGPVAKFS